MEKLAYNLRAACSILDSYGWSEKKIIAYVEKAKQPTPGYIYLDNIEGVK